MDELLQTRTKRTTWKITKAKKPVPILEYAEIRDLHVRKMRRFQINVKGDNVLDGGNEIRSKIREIWNQIRSLLTHKRMESVSDILKDFFRANMSRIGNVGYCSQELLVLKFINESNLLRKGHLFSHSLPCILAKSRDCVVFETAKKDPVSSAVLVRLEIMDIMHIGLSNMAIDPSLQKDDQIIWNFFRLLERCFRLQSFAFESVVGSLVLFVARVVGL